MRIYDAPSELAGKWIREADHLAALRRAKVEGMIEAMCVIRCDPSNMRGTCWIDHDDVETLQARIAELEQSARAAQIEEGA